MSEEKSLADQAQQQLFFQTLMMSMPDIVKFYPQIENIVNTINKSGEEYLGDDKKMILIVKKRGVTRAVILNAQSDFTITNGKDTFSIEGNKDVILANYEKEEYRKKLFELPIIQMLKEKYEKLASTSLADELDQQPDLLKQLTNI